MHPYRLIPRVLVQAEILKNKPVVQAVCEFSSFVSQLFLYHHCDAQEESSKNLMIGLANLSFFRMIYPSIFYSIPENCKKGFDINLMIEEIQDSLHEEYGNEDLQQGNLYQTHYCNIYMFCQYLMYKALKHSHPNHFHNFLKNELQNFVIKEFGPVPWTYEEIFRCILTVIALLLMISSALLLTPSITQWIALQYVIEVSTIIISGISGLFTSGFVLFYTCSRRSG